MNEMLCFRLEDKSLFMEQVFVEYENNPIFYLCKSGEQRYLVLCVDMDENRYVIVETSLQNVWNMLQGKITMRDSIVNCDKYWEVIAGEDFESDMVEQKPMQQVSEEDLPEKGAYYKIATKNVQKFCDSLLTGLDLYYKDYCLTDSSMVLEIVSDENIEGQITRLSMYWDFSCVMGNMKKTNFKEREGKDMQEYGDEDNLAYAA